MYLTMDTADMPKIADNTQAAISGASRAFSPIRFSQGSTPNTLKYTGREQDPSGLYYYRARYYDPETRRFLTEDPIGFDGGVNFYVYAENNPVVGNDPTGKCFNCATAVIGLVASGAGNAIGQYYRNGGFSNFSVTEFVVASGVGFVAGAIAPVTIVSSIATGSGANLAQYLITQSVTRKEITPRGTALALASGAVGGFLGGAANRPAGALLNRGATGLQFVENPPLARQLNSAFANQAVTGPDSAQKPEEGVDHYFDLS